MIGAPVASLSEGQRDCLRLVLEQHSSKGIARVLKISPHTVDRRLKVAMKTLGASTRFEAARMLANAEPGYQSLVYQAPDLVGEGTGEAALPKLDPRSAHKSRRASNVDERQNGSYARLLVAAIVVAGVAITFAALFVGLVALSEFTR